LVKAGSGVINLRTELTSKHYGRPREFDEDEVLRAALRVFWEKGYESTSLSDLLAAMGLTKSSLYKAFGSKEALFWRVVERYQRD
jgi:AcrR family transcriptional regulator